MSTYQKTTKNPVTGKWEKAVWIDDYFGNHHYGVQFEGEEKVYDPEDVELETK